MVKPSGNSFFADALILRVVVVALFDDGAFDDDAALPHPARPSASTPVETNLMIEFFNGSLFFY